MKTRTKTALVALAATASLGLGTNAATAASGPMNYRNAGDCTAYSALTWGGGVVHGAGMVPCSLRHSSTAITVSVVRNGVKVGAQTYRFSNSLGTGSTRWHYSANANAGGCNTYYALTEVSVSGVGTWSVRSNSQSLCS